MMAIELKVKYKPAGPVFLLTILPFILLIGLWSTNSTVQNIQQTAEFSLSRSLVDPGESNTAYTSTNEGASQKGTRHAEQPDPVDQNEAEITGEVSDEPSIDIISVGSITKQEYHEAQQRTFGAHRLVRNFFTVNELNDTDASCHTAFTNDQLMQVVTFCNSTEGQTLESALLRTRLYWPKRHTGWMCAQKRPIDGIRAALDYYKTHPIPNYLLIIDDDTYVNVDSLTETITKAYPVTESHVVGGCIYRWPRKLEFRFPTGGFGSILTRAAIERLMKPIYCESANPDEFTKFACWRLDLNHVGEKQYFKEGMSVGDLMYQYSAELPFTRVDQWNNNTGYCFHSDHALGYFFNFYHLVVPTEGLMGDPDDKLRIEHSYEYLAGNVSECEHEKKKCTVDSRLCHYVKPEQMEQLYEEHRLAHPQ